MLIRLIISIKDLNDRKLCGTVVGRAKEYRRFRRFIWCFSWNSGQRRKRNDTRRETKYERIFSRNKYQETHMIVLDKSHYRCSMDPSSINVCTSNACRDTCVCGNYFVARWLFVMQFHQRYKVQGYRDRIEDIFLRTTESRCSLSIRYYWIIFYCTFRVRNNLDNLFN